jgi:hypothetical protein
MIAPLRTPEDWLPNEPFGGFLYDCVKRINKEVSTSESNQIKSCKERKTTETYRRDPFLGVSAQQTKVM